MVDRPDHDAETRSSERSDADARTQRPSGSEPPDRASGRDREPPDRTSGRDRNSTGRPVERNPEGGAGDTESRGSSSTGKIGTIARRTLVTLLVVAVLSVTVLGLGFLVYRGSVSPGPFLLLVGIVVGFVLGRLDAVL